jgi:hypothetical protein
MHTNNNRKLQSPVVTIEVGENLKIHIHKGMLTDAAEYFENMFDGSFKEGIEDSAEFPEDDENAWQELAMWCYTGALAPLRPLQPTNTVHTSSCWTRLRLCCLAEKYGRRLLQNLAVDSLNGLLRGCGGLASITIYMFRQWTMYVHDNTHEKSP